MQIGPWMTLSLRFRIVVRGTLLIASYHPVSGASGTPNPEGSTEAIQALIKCHFIEIYLRTILITNFAHPPASHNNACSDSKNDEEKGGT